MATANSLSFVDHYPGGVLAPYNAGEVPVPGHVGAYLAERRFHIHKGVDLYGAQGEAVYAVEDSTVILCTIFTGPEVGSPWWNTTKALMCIGASGAVVYGEIEPDPSIYIGKRVKRGERIGAIETVLLIDKGRPMSMLHFEFYHTPDGDTINFRDQGRRLDPTENLLKAEPWNKP